MKTLVKSLHLILIISLIYYPCLPNSIVSAETDDTLAASSRINKFADANKITIDTGKFIMAISYLKEIILDEKIPHRRKIEAIEEANRQLEGTGISIDSNINEGVLKGTKTKILYLVANFPKAAAKTRLGKLLQKISPDTYKTMRIAFIKDHAELEKQAMKKLGIKTQKDIDYFRQSPLSGIWIFKEIPSFENSNSGTARVLTLAMLVPFAALLFEGCLDAPSLKGYCFLGQPCNYDNLSAIINAGADYTNDRVVTLLLSGKGINKVRISEKEDFEGAEWQNFNPNEEGFDEVDFILSKGDGEKKVYIQFAYYDEKEGMLGESSVFLDTIILDMTSPQIYLAEGIAGSTTNDPEITVSGTYVDTNIGTITVNGIEAQIDKEDETTGIFTAEVPLQEGDNKITIVGIDKAGNSSAIATAKVTYTPVAPPTDPGISIDEGNYTDTQDINLTLGVKGTKEMRIYEPGGFDTGWIPFNPTYTFQLTPGDGEKIVNVEYRNSAGKTDAVSDTITLDTTAPQIAIDSPTDGFETDSPTVIVTGTYIEDNPESITVNGIPAIFANGSFSAENVSLQEGPNTITVTITDKVGKSSEDTVNVTYTPVAPPTDPGISIDEGNYTDTQDINLTLGVKGAKEMRIYEVGGFDTGWIPYSPTYTFQLSSGDGIKTVNVEYKNSAGETDAVSDTIILDTTAPQIAIDSPTDGFETDSPTVIVTGTYIEANPESITVNGIPAIFANGSFSAEVPLNEGPNTITVTITDKVGKSTNKDIKVTYTPVIPPTDPGISIDKGDYTDTQSINLTLTVQGAKDMRIYEQGGNDTGWIPYSPTYTFQISPGDGKKTVNVLYKNSAGETSAVSDTITLDTTLPQIEITSPTDGFEANNPTVTVIGTYDEANIDSITVNDISANLSNGSFSVQVPLTEGDNTLTVKATDKAGNSSEKIVKVKYTPAPSIETIYGTATDCDNTQQVTLLSLDTKPTISGKVNLYANPDFVCGNNAAYEYAPGTIEQYTLTAQDQDNILANGITLFTNGAKSLIQIKGIGLDGKEKVMIFDLKVAGDIDYTQSYKFNINPFSYFSTIFYIEIENLDNKDLILNGLKRQYTAIAIPGEITPDKIGPEWSIFNSEAASITPVQTPEGININFSMTAGDNGQSVALNVPTKSGGVNVTDPNLQGFWPMDKTALGTDSGPNGNILANVNGVESVPGKYGNAAQFTAANKSYLMIPPEQQNGLHITGDMTVSAWIKVNGFPKGVFVIAARQTNNDALVDYTFIIDNDGSNRLASWNGSSLVYSNGSISLDSWHHVVFVRSGNQITFYLDGKENGSSSQEFPNTVKDAPFLVGSNSGATVYANGEIDELAVFDRDLTLEEIQDVYNNVNSSNFLNPALATTELKTRGNSPFILQLIDKTGQVLDVFVLGLDPANWKTIAANIIKAQGIMNPLFDLNNVESVKILIQDTFLPGQDGMVFNGTIDIQGLVGIPPTTRHRYATDSHDIDITAEDYTYLTQNLRTAKTILLETRNGIPVMGITEWQDIILQDGLGFSVNGRVYSAFTVRDGGGSIIYIPHPDLIRSKLGTYINDKILGAIERRNSIIINHELDEIHKPDHREAVFNEFSNNSMNGLNYADVVTILLETLFSGNFIIIDEHFHRQFIANLLTQGMFLDKGGNTYLSIIREMVDGRIDEDVLRQMYTRIIGEITGLVTSHRFTHRRLSKGEITISDIELQKEPGFAELLSAIEEFNQSGTIYIDLAKFFVKNTSLATEDEVSTIDSEYLKRFTVLVRKLQGTNVHVKGIYSQRGQRPVLIEQLTSIIREDLGLSDEQFPIQVVDFTKYLEFVQNSRNTVSILTESSWHAIPDRSQLKIVDSTIDRYTHVNSSGWEFYAALKGLIYDTPHDFLTFIIDEVLQQLTVQKVITTDEAERLKQEILKKGLALIPSYSDPILYYKTIESQKQLLIAA